MPRKHVVSALVDDGEPADTIVRCLMVGFVHPWPEIHRTVVLALNDPKDDA